MSKKGETTAGTKVTITRVAQRLGLSLCTVSRILNDKIGSAKYRPATIDRVRRVAREMGYRADMVARALVEGRTWMLGLCVADIANPVFGEFASCFERATAAAGYSTFVCNTREDPEAERRYVDMLLARRVDALVISPVSASVAPALAEAVRGGRRVVVFDRDVEGDEFHRVQVDNRAGMAKLARRCIALGHTSIGVLRGYAGDSSLGQRADGVADAVRAAGLDARSAIVTPESSMETTVEAGRAGFRELVRGARRPTLVLGLCNVLTIGALAEARALGVAIGRDVSFAGFDDFAGADIATPPVTVTAQPVARMAEECARLASAQNLKKARTVRLPVEVRWRDSVVRPGD